MKFYYEGRLIRTSKTHHYKWALLDSDGDAVTCSVEKERCESRKRAEFDRARRLQKNYEISDMDKAAKRMKDFMRLIENEWAVVPLEEK